MHITSKFAQYLMKTYTRRELINLIYNSDPATEIENVNKLIDSHDFLMELAHEAYMRIDSDKVVLKIKRYIDRGGK